MLLALGCLLVNMALDMHVDHALSFSVTADEFVNYLNIIFVYSFRRQYSLQFSSDVETIFDVLMFLKYSVDCVVLGCVASNKFHLYYYSPCVQFTYMMW